MIALWGWIIKLVGGWLPIGTKPFGEWLGKIIWVVGIVAVCFLGYRKIMQPTTSEHTDQTIHSGGQAVQVHYNNNPKLTFGCASWDVREYYDRKPVNGIIK